MSNLFTPLSELLNPNQALPVRYLIPPYQRHYTWTKKEWSQLFKDISPEESSLPHYLGSVILIKKTPNESDKFQYYDVIDGQQRLTTLSIFLTVIYDKLSRLDNDNYCNKKFLSKPEADELISVIMSIKKMIITPDTHENRIILSNENNNISDYKYLLFKSNLIYDKIVEEPERFGNRRIKLGYNFFDKIIDEEIYEKYGEDCDTNKKEIVSFLVEKFEFISKCHVVVITTENESQAFRLFDTVNNRGTPLSSLDIIKSKILESVANKNLSVDDSNEVWGNMVKQLDDFRDRERYIRHYYNVFQRSIRNKRTTKGRLIDDYSKTINNSNPNELIQDLFEKSYIYSSLVNPDKPNIGKKNEEKKLKIFKSLRRLSKLGAAPAYALLLYIFTDNKFDENEKLITVDYLVKFFVRRHLTDRPSSKYLDTIFSEKLMDYIRNLGARIDEGTFLDFFEKNKEKFRLSTDSDLKDSISGNIYIENIDVAKFVLCHLEESRETDEVDRKLWETDNKNKSKWSIEHVLPQNPKLPNGWKKVLEAEGTLDEYQDVLHTFGNLTLTAYNSNLSDKSFNEKKNKQDAEGNSIGFNNGLWLNHSISKEKNWNVEKIKKRTDKLVKEIMNLYCWDDKR